MKEIRDGSVVYVETSILLTLLLGEQGVRSRDHRCLQFFKDIERKRIKGVVSLLAIYETIDVLKRKISEMDNSSIIGGRVNSLRQLIFQKLDALGVRIDDLDSTMQSKDEPSVLTSAGRYVESTPVVFDQNKFNQETKEYGRWDSIGLLDCMHLVMAEQGDVDCLLTYDSHYKRILGSSVESILIREVYQ